MDAARRRSGNAPGPLKRWGRRLLGGALALACYAGVVAWQCYRVVQAPAAVSVGGNGLWLGHRWLDDRGRPRVTADQLARLGRRARAAGVRQLFVHAGPVDARGELPPRDRRRCLELQAGLRREIPGVRLLAWLGAPNAAYLGAAADTVDLSRLDTRAQLGREIRGLVDAGFDGIQLDFEPLADGDPDFLRLLDELREGPGVLAVAVPLLRPGSVPSALPWMTRFWSEAGLSEVGRRVDQVALMGYDTMQPRAALYEQFLASQVSRARRALTGCRAALVVGLPTYEDNWPHHVAAAETLAAGWRGALRGGAADVAFYAEWTTDEAEWATAQTGPGSTVRKANP